MTTTLQAQLAQIAAKSSDPLNLKAHRRAWAQSLLFSSTVAAQQSLDALFEICHEGFQELCSLDSRFQPFAKTIFSEQSKREDRSQLNASQNNELDHVLESFLSLLGSRILLKPALKALEWLIRQFRVHEMNTAYILYTFIPYHSMPHFITLLSILPRSLPSNFQFLVPYQSQSASPPHQEIVYAAARNASFWREWSLYVLDICRKEHQYHNLIAYWASVTTEALSTQIENASRGNRVSEQQKISDIIHNVLPVINEALSMTAIQDMRISALMLLTVLVSKTALVDQTLGKTMEAVVKDATKTTRDAELICLAVLAQKRSSMKLPRKIVRFLSSIETIAEDLATLNEQYDVGNLTSGLIQGVAQNKAKNLTIVSPDFVETAVCRRLMSEEQAQVVFSSILRGAQDLSDETPEQIRNWLCNTLRSISESTHCQPAFRQSLDNIKDDVPQLEGLLQLGLRLEKPEIEMMESAENAILETGTTPNAQDVFNKISSHSFEGGSFLTHTESHILAHLTEVFSVSVRSRQLRSRFIDLPIFQKGSNRDVLLSCSFLLRMLGEGSSSQNRNAALLGMVDCIKASEEDLSFLVQSLLPYLVYCLSDVDDSVRSAAATLGATIQQTQASKQPRTTDPKAFDASVHVLYGADEDRNVSWLSNSDAQSFINEILLPTIEESRSDSTYTTQVLLRCLGPDQSLSGASGDISSLKLSQKESMFKFLLDHVAHTPLLDVKIRLLTTFTTVVKIGHTSKFKRLSELIASSQKLNEADLVRLCAQQSVNPKIYVHALVSVFDARDKASLKALEENLTHDLNIEPSIFQVGALERLLEIWRRLKTDVIINFAELLFKRAVGYDSSTQEQKGRNLYLEVLRQLSLPLTAVTRILEQVPRISQIGGQEKPIPKRRKLSQGSSAIPTEFEVAEARRTIALALELAEGSTGGSSPSLVPLYFDLLADLHHVKDIDTSMTYMQTLLMDLLNKAIDEAIQAKISLDRPSLRVELVVDYFRHSTNTQLQQASLLLMSSLAAVAPDEVMNSIMPVFTFMGSTILQQFDDFSVFVINKTIESVIPQLLVSLQKDKRGALAGVSELMLSFVAAFEHIAPHRRHDVFATLVDKIDPHAFLFVFPTMLIDKQGSGKDIVDFAVGIVAAYSCTIQMHAIHSCFDVMSDGLRKKSTMAKHLFSMERFPDHQATVVAITHLVDRWMCSGQLTTSIAKVLRKGSDDAEALQRSFAKLLEQVLRLVDQSASTPALEARSQFLLKRVLGLFPLEHSLKALHGLLQTADNTLKCQVLQSLEGQIAVQNANNDNARVACLDFLEQLKSILSDASDQQLKKGSMSCIDRIIEKFGKAKPAAVLAVVADVSGPNGISNEDVQLRSMAFVCLTTIVEAIEDAFIPHIPRTLPVCLTFLEQDLQCARSEDNTTSAGWAFVSSLLLFIPYILTGEYLDRMLNVAFKESNLTANSRRTKTIANATTLISNQVAAKECFSALSRTWSVAKQCGPKAVKLYLSMFDSSIEKLPKAVAVKQSNAVASLFLVMMDLRRSEMNNPIYGKTEMDEIERNLNATMTKMIYKLNDKYFRPIFARTIEWGNEETVAQDREGSIARRSTLFGFLAHFFQTLKSIVTGYSSFVTEGAAEVLQSFEPQDATSMLLWNRVLATLSASFEYDQDEFWQSPAHFSSIAPVLLKQVQWGTEPQTAAKVISCISALATAVDSSDSRKYINSELLVFFRHENAAVRLTAVRCEQDLTELLGEEWLSMLPEMLPFISEALEDDDEEVEMETRRWVRKVEEILGESLDPMLQ